MQRNVINDAGKILKSTNVDTAGRGRKSQGIEHNGQLGRKLRENTVSGVEAGLREEWNKELTSKTKSGNWPKPPS